MNKNELKNKLGGQVWGRLWNEFRGNPWNELEAQSDKFFTKNFDPKLHDRLMRLHQFMFGGNFYTIILNQVRADLDIR